MIKSDWHMHSVHSYDSTLPLEKIVKATEELGIEEIGVTDHLNYNDESFIGNIKDSMAAIKAGYPSIIPGVELTPIAKPMFDYIARTGSREGYVPPYSASPYPIELGMSMDELMSLGVRYAVGGAHWRVDRPSPFEDNSLYAQLKEWHRQQMYLACDERVTVLAHPWNNSSGIWYENFSLIPRGMNLELGAALLENRKYIECNGALFGRASEGFCRGYAEFLRELFEMGVRVTYGSDCHNIYTDRRENTVKYLSLVGFSSGDICAIDKNDLYY